MFIQHFLKGRHQIIGILFNSSNSVSKNNLILVDDFKDFEKLNNLHYILVCNPDLAEKILRCESRSVSQI